MENTSKSRTDYSEALAPLAPWVILHTFGTEVDPSLWTKKAEALLSVCFEHFPSLSESQKLYDLPAVAESASALELEPFIALMKRYDLVHKYLVKKLKIIQTHGTLFLSEAEFAKRNLLKPSQFEYRRQF